MRFSLACASCLSWACHAEQAPPDAPPPVICAAEEVTLADGTCFAPGVPPERCAAGFAPDDGFGCVPVLPAERCPPGTMAVPGDSVCREVAPCSEGVYGDVPIDGTTQHVDASYAGTDSDGTAARPWSTIAGAVAAAVPGAIVAIAAGSYAEDVSIQQKSVRLWGRCPGLVEIVGTGASLGAVFVRLGASGTEIRDLAVRGSGAGIVTSGSDVLVDRVWVHDTMSIGVDAEDALGPSTLTLSRSLVEGTRILGVASLGATLTVESSVVRDVRAGSDPESGVGIGAFISPQTARAALTVMSSVVEGNFGYGIYVDASDVTVEASVVRDTQLQEATQLYGRALDVEHGTTATVVGAVLERNLDAGVFASGSTLSLEDSVVRDTLPLPADGRGGRGVVAQLDPTTAAPSTLTLRSSLVMANHETGVFAASSNAWLEGVRVQGTQPQPADGWFGRGIEVRGFMGTRGKLDVMRCAVDSNSEVGIAASGSDVTIDESAIRDTRARAIDGTLGRGINVQYDVDALDPVSLMLRHTTVERSVEAGLFVGGSHAIVESLIVTDTRVQPASSKFGDGIVVATLALPGSATIDAARVTRSARAGIGNFGAHVTLGGSAFECNAIDLDGETFAETTYAFEDLGNNQCGCEGEAIACQVKSSSLQPPPAL